MSSQTHAARPGRLGLRENAPSKSSEIDWERIMVQITFAFVIILGYLVSVGVDEATQLAAETEAQSKRNELLQSILAQLKGTELGEALAGRVAAEKEMQLERLLRIWAERCVQRSLYALLRQFNNAELIPLSNDLRCLPTAESFPKLNHEIERVFLADNRHVSTSEITRLTKDVLLRAGFDPEAVQSMSDHVAASDERRCRRIWRSTGVFC